MSKKSEAMMQALAAATRANVPTILWGNPGIGKSQKLSAMMTSWHRHLEVVVGSCREPADFMGLPTEVSIHTREEGADYNASLANNATGYHPPAWAVRLDQSTSGSLFLDELTTSAPTVQKVMLRTLQEREVGEFTLKNHISIIAAANPPESAVDGYDLPSPIANRLFHLDWVFDADEWHDGLLTGEFGTDIPAMEKLIGEHNPDAYMVNASLVSSFLRRKPDVLDPGPPENETEAGRAWPSPRSWHNAVKLLAEVPNDDEHKDARFLIVAGCVGTGIAREFSAWASSSNLPDPRDVIANPDSVQWPKMRADIRFVLANSIASVALVDGTADMWTKAVSALAVGASQGCPDGVLNAANTLIRRRPDEVNLATDLPDAAFNAFKDVFVQLGTLTESATPKRRRR